MDLGLRGRTALVTGASKGIGLACAISLAGEGCNLHLASRSAADLEVARDKVRARARADIALHPCDLSDSAQVTALAGHVGDLDVLVNNAGAIPGGDLARIDEATWRKAWDLKVFGYINLTRLVYAAMKARGSGVIINVIGRAGERPRADYIAGSAANAGLMAFTNALGGTAPDDGLRVVGVNPGMVLTERLEALYRTQAATKWGDPARGPELLAAATARLPFSRPGRPDEVGDVVAFLASDRASYVSGTIVTVDAGQTIRF
jgi:NAD(P)-dependent dehydrogenase (short-subunit alcohol dehydrogenase family)